MVLFVRTPIVPYSITFSGAYVENKHLLIPKLIYLKRKRTGIGLKSFISPNTGIPMK